MCIYLLCNRNISGIPRLKPRQNQCEYDIILLIALESKMYLHISLNKLLSLSQAHIHTHPHSKKQQLTEDIFLFLFLSLSLSLLPTLGQLYSTASHPGGPTSETPASKEPPGSRLTTLTKGRL